MHWKMGVSVWLHFNVDHFCNVLEEFNAGAHSTQKEMVNDLRIKDTPSNKHQEIIVLVKDLDYQM